MSKPIVFFWWTPRRWKFGVQRSRRGGHIISLGPVMVTIRFERSSP